MQCPVCGYAMGPFDTECERCKRMGQQASKATAPISYAPQPTQPVQPPPQPTYPEYSVPQPGSAIENNSGTRMLAPPEVYMMGWSWGAFCFTWIWGLCNSVWISLLGLIPYVNIVVCVWLGVKGHELAWQSRRFESFEHYRLVMETWDKIGLIVFIASLILGFVIGIGLAPLWSW
jgi:hypothetical protein